LDADELAGEVLANEIAAEHSFRVDLNSGVETCPRTRHGTVLQRVERSRFAGALFAFCSPTCTVEDVVAVTATRRGGRSVLSSAFQIQGHRIAGTDVLIRDHSIGLGVERIVLENGGVDAQSILREGIVRRGNWPAACCQEQGTDRDSLSHRNHPTKMGRRCASIMGVLGPCLTTRRGSARYAPSGSR
jgi:hypothetical protein